MKLVLLAAVCLGFTQLAAAQSCTAESPCDLTVWQIFSDHQGDWMMDTAQDTRIPDTPLTRPAST